MKLTHWLASLFERVAAIFAGVATTQLQAAALKEQSHALAALEEQANDLEQRGLDGLAARLREQAAGLSLTDAAALGAAALAAVEGTSPPALEDNRQVPERKTATRNRNR